MLNPLDNSAVHPAYSIVRKMAKDLLTVNDLIANKEKTALIKPENYYCRNRFIDFKDIIKELENQD
jgi:uncharacterized protein